MRNSRWQMLGLVALRAAIGYVAVCSTTQPEHRPKPERMQWLRNGGSADATGALNKSRGQDRVAQASTLAAVETVAKAATAQSGKMPNIVMVFMDNCGYGELGCYGGGIT